MEEMDSIKFHCLECGQAILLTEVILNGTLSKHGYVRGICPNCGTIIPLFLEKEKDGVLIYLANQNWRRFSLTRANSTRTCDADSSRLRMPAFAGIKQRERSCRRWQL
jgi:uncharacterized Zn finger protein